MHKTKPTSNATKRTIAPSTRNTAALSSEELEALKKRKQIEYLKYIISARDSSTKKSPSTSTVLDGQSTSKSGDELLLKTKENAFDIDMFQLLEKDNYACFGIKDLLKQVDGLSATLEVAGVIIDQDELAKEIQVGMHHVERA